MEKTNTCRSDHACATAMVLLITLFILVGTVSESRADDAEDWQPTESRSFLNLSPSWTPGVSLVEQTGKIRESEWKMKGDFALSSQAQQPIDASSTTRYLRYSINPEASVANIEHPYAVSTQVFYHFRLSGKVMLMSSGREFYVLRIGVGESEESHTLRAPKLRYSGMLFGTYHNDADLYFVYGLSVSHSFGEQRLFPVLGLLWRFAPQWRFNTLLPLSMSVQYELNSAVKLGVFAKIKGGQYHLKNDNMFPGRADDIYFSEVGLRLGLMASYHISDWTLGLEISTMRARTIFFKDSSGTIVSNRVNPAPNVAASINYIF